MYSSKAKMWFLFAVWVFGAILCGMLDSSRNSTLLLPIFLLSSIIVVVLATRRHRARNYRFNLVRPGVVLSPLGFEVHASSSGLEYIERDHIMSWAASSSYSTVGRFDLSERAMVGWQSPFDSEPIPPAKKREINKAVISALTYLQLIDAGKIRPKRILAE